MKMLSGALLSAMLFLVPAAAATSRYKLVAKPAQKIDAVMTFTIKAPNLVAREWFVVAPRAYSMPGQRNVSSALLPAGKPSQDLSQWHRPILVARYGAGTNGVKGTSMTARYRATLMARELVPLKAGEKAPTLPTLAGAERLAALAATARLDHQAPKFQTWLKSRGLRAKMGEDDLALARRIFLSIKKTFTYQYPVQCDIKASALAPFGKCDCGGMSAVFVAACRANRIPARMLVGRWATSAAKVKPGATYEGQWHVKAEFYALGIGWVPVDLSSAINFDKTPEGLKYFGNDPGDFITLHLDFDMVWDTVNWGKATDTYLQGFDWRASGGGNFTGMTTKETWTVTKLSS
jgi:hypothetical protein